MTMEEALKKLDVLQKKMSAYSHAMGLISYDSVTTAPKNTTANRGQTLSVLGEESYMLTTSENTWNLLNFLDSKKDELDEKTRRIVKIMLKNLKETRAIPMDEYLAYQQLVNEADDVWHRAKENNDYKSFEPYLQKIFDTCRKFAGYMKPGEHPYNVWMDTFEEGLTMDKCDKFFETLKKELVPVIKKVSEAKQLDDSFLNQKYPKAKQEELSKYIMDVMKIDKGHCGLGETEHPFTTNFSKYDVRITTHYYDNLTYSMYSVVHEGGHALYELNTGDEYAYTALGTGVSMAIHESQSRFYENIIGRSKEFVSLIYPKLKELFPEQLKGVTEEQLYLAVNKSEPSLVRTEADELTYCLHIMVRYELEKRMFNGELTAKELPEEWNRLYKEYLGIDVPTDKQGVLQDSHWSGGLVGYFPSYALGSAYGAQLLSKMEETIDVTKCIKEERLEEINDWLRENIWKYGCMYEPNVLLEKALGKPFDPSYYINYLKNKYTEIYGL
jgi:carboxypeptidase Taq